MTANPNLDLSFLDPNEGVVFDGLNDTRTRFGSQIKDFLGSELSPAGDINGDGLDDFIIGTNSIVNYVIFGSTSGFPNSNLTSVNGRNGFRVLGTLASGIGDINGDGFDDILIGTPYNSPEIEYDIERDIGYVIFGKSDSFDPLISQSSFSANDGFQLTRRITGDFGFRSPGQGGYGFNLINAVSSAGDFNGDGFDDFAIGNFNPYYVGYYFYDYATFYNRKSIIVFGQEDFSSDVVLSEDVNSLTLEATGTLFRANKINTSNAGDINGDGFDDLLVGVPDRDDSRYYFRTPRNGTAYVVFGKDNDLDTDIDLETLNRNNGLIIRGLESYDRLGYSVSGAGDLNGDGLNDIIVSSPSANPDGKEDAGEAYVIFGTTTNSSRNFNLDDLNGNNGFRVKGLNAGDLLGSSVSDLGDVNGDGFDDIIIGAKNAGFISSGDPREGESYVIFGKDTGFSANFDLNSLDGINGFKIFGTQPDEELGRSVSGVGDANGDGFNDILVAAPSVDVNDLEDAGQTYLLFGSEGGFTPSENQTFEIKAVDAVKEEGNSNITNFTFEIIRRGITNQTTSVDFTIAGEDIDENDFGFNPFIDRTVTFTPNENNKIIPLLSLSENCCYF